MPRIFGSSNSKEFIHAVKYIRIITHIESHYFESRGGNPINNRLSTIQTVLKVIKADKSLSHIDTKAYIKDVEFLLDLIHSMLEIHKKETGDA